MKNIIKITAVTVLFATLLLVSLKYEGAIDWQWSWVLSPMWISLPILIATILASAAIYAAKNSR